MIKRCVKWQFSSLMYLIFFTRVFTGRLRISKNPIISQRLHNKINIFTSRQSKIKNKSFFFLSTLTLDWRLLGNLCPQEALAQRIKQHACYKMRVLTWKGEWRTDLASSWICLQRFMFQNCVLESVLFE